MEVCFNTSDINIAGLLEYAEHVAYVICVKCMKTVMIWKSNGGEKQCKNITNRFWVVTPNMTP